MRPSTLLLPFYAILPLTTSLTLHLTLPSPPPPALPPSTHIRLLSNKVLITAPLSSSSVFTIHNLTSAAYSVSINANSHQFPTYRLTVGPGKVELTQTFLSQAWDAPGPVVGTWENYDDMDVENEVVEMTLPQGTGQPRVFYESRGGFSPLDLLKSPMILLALFSLAMVFGMPYILDSMDDEMRAEFNEAQKKSPLNAAASATGSGQNPLSNFDMAGWMAGQKSSSGGGGASSSGRDAGEGRKRR